VSHGAGSMPDVPDVPTPPSPASPLAVLVVIPTYQEAANIETVLTRVQEAEPRAHVLVVDDNSPDGTAELAEKAGEKQRQGKIRVLKRPGKSGLGSAYRAGFAWGLQNGFDVLIEMDADLSHNPNDLPRLIEGIESGADLVVGSRYVSGGAIPGWPAHRALLSRGGNIYARRMLSLPLNDATSGFRAYRSEVMKRINLGTVRAEGYGFQIEMAYRMFRHGGTIKEVPITFIDRIEGVSKMSSKIVVEALALVTMWGVRDRVRRLTSGKRSVIASVRSTNG
jgi:dolichol-phosphate mannosyltransferase